MVVYPITYKDFDGNEVTDKLMFHISKVEATRLDAECPGGLEAYMDKIGDEQNPDAKAIFDLIYKLILMGYGRKSDDGKRFIKSKKETEEFEESLAFEALFEELTSEEGKLQEFFQNVVARK